MVEVAGLAVSVCDVVSVVTEGVLPEDVGRGSSEKTLVAFVWYISQGKIIFGRSVAGGVEGIW